MKLGVVFLLVILALNSCFTLTSCVGTEHNKHEVASPERSRLCKVFRKIITTASPVVVGVLGLYHIYTMEPVEQFTDSKSLEKVTKSPEYLLSRVSILSTVIISTAFFTALKRYYVEVYSTTTAIHGVESLEEIPRPQKGKKDVSRIKYADTRVSLIHALVSSTGVAFAYAHSKYNNITYDPIYMPTLPCYVLAVSTGFFVWELLGQIQDPTIHGHIYTFHSVFGIALTGLTSLGLVGLEPCYILGIEFSSIFLNLKHLMSTDKRLEAYKNSSFAVINDLCFAISFIALRVVLLSWASYSAVNKLNSAYTMLDQVLYPLPEKLNISPQRARQFVFYTNAICVFLLLVMNYHWAIFVILKVVDTLFGTTPNRVKQN